MILLELLVRSAFGLAAAALLLVSISVSVVLCLSVVDSVARVLRGDDIR